MAGRARGRGGRGNVEQLAEIAENRRLIEELTRTVQNLQRQRLAEACMELSARNHVTVDNWKEPKDCFGDKDATHEVKETFGWKSTWENDPIYDEYLEEGEEGNSESELICLFDAAPCYSFDEDEEGKNLKLVDAPDSSGTKEISFLKQDRLLSCWLNRKRHFPLRKTLSFEDDPDDALYSDVTRPSRRSDRNPAVTPMKVLIQRTKAEREAKNAQPCRMLEEPSENGWSVPQIGEVAQRVYQTCKSLLCGSSSLVRVISVQYCRFWNEVRIDHVGHEIRTSTEAIRLDTGIINDVAVLSKAACVQEMVVTPGCIEGGVYWYQWVPAMVFDDWPSHDPPDKIVITASNTNDKRWVLIIKKTYAQLHGCYEAVEGGLVRDALVHFTGSARNFTRLSIFNDSLQIIAEDYICHSITEVRKTLELQGQLSSSTVEPLSGLVSDLRAEASTVVLSDDSLNCNLIFVEKKINLEGLDEIELDRDMVEMVISSNDVVGGRSEELTNIVVTDGGISDDGETGEVDRLRESLMRKLWGNNEKFAPQVHNIPREVKASVLVAKFYYETKMELTASNVVTLIFKCAAEFNHMTEDYDEGNLIVQTENFIGHVFGPSGVQSPEKTYRWNETSITSKSLIVGLAYYAKRHFPLLYSQSSFVGLAYYAKRHFPLLYSQSSFQNGDSVVFKSIPSIPPDANPRSMLEAIVELPLTGNGHKNGVMGSYFLGVAISYGLDLFLTNLRLYMMNGHEPSVLLPFIIYAPGATLFLGPRMSKLNAIEGLKQEEVVTVAPYVHLTTIETNGFVENIEYRNNTANEYYLVKQLILDKFMHWTVSYKIEGIETGSLAILLLSTVNIRKNLSVLILKFMVKSRLFFTPEYGQIARGGV